MKKVSVFVCCLAVVVLAMFGGCPSPTNSSRNNDRQPPAQLTTDNPARVVAATVDLPAPSAGNAGYLYYVIEEDAFRYSDGDEYLDIDLTGPAGPAGTTVEWIGQVDAFPSEPVANQAIFHSLLRNAYIFDGTDWQLVTQSGATWLTGTGAPADSVGNNGDLYLDSSAWNIYRKVNGTWGSAIGNIGGADGIDGLDGEAGSDGVSWLVGTGAPSAVGQAGDLYLDGATGNVYVYGATGGWGAPYLNLLGPQGATGATGPTGDDGADGATWITGTGTPSNAVGTDGDLYFDLVSGNISTKSEGAWSYRMNIFGRDQYSVTIKIVANLDQPDATAVSGVEVTADGAWVGFTDRNGEIVYSSSASGAVEIGAAKEFFVTTTDTESAAFPGSAGATVPIELVPQIFVPDANNGRIVRFDDMAGSNATVVSQVGDGFFRFYGLTWVVPDYERGVLYAASERPIPTGDLYPTVLRLEKFPPTMADVEFMISALQSPTGDMQPSLVGPGANYDANFLNQISLLPDGTGVIGSDSWESDMAGDGSKIVILNDGSLRMDGYYFTRNQASSEPIFQGVTVLPDGRYLYAETGEYGTVGTTQVARLGIIDDITDSAVSAVEPFVPETLDLWGSGDGQLMYPTTIHVSHDEQYVYVSDTGFPGGPGALANHRIVRYDIDGTNPVSLGGPDPGNGVGAFSHPVILGVLPDNRIYVLDNGDMSEGIDRLVRIDNIDGDGWVELSAWNAESFDFLVECFDQVAMPE